MDTLNKPESVRKLFGRSITAKVAAIGVLLLMFLIPATMVDSLVLERSFRGQDTKREVASRWGKAQSLAGPMLIIPYHTYLVEQELDYAIFLPKELTIKTTADVQTRARGIYKVPVYETHAEISGFFDAPNIGALRIAPSQLLQDQATVIFGIPDLRGIQKEAVMQWGNTPHTLAPGVITGIVKSGLSSSVPIPQGRVPFSLTLDLRGTEEFAFVPLGKKTNITMHANWPSPSFTGSFLPVSHTITDQGFDAEWQLLDLNRDFPEQWTGEKYRIAYLNDSLFADDSNMNTFGVQFLQPVDVYDKTGRSTKYAIAVIALVFASVFFTEATSRRRVHPVQYLLIGLSLIIFYTLLLSLAEYLPFGFAYLIASVAIIGMVTLFTKSVTKSTPLGILNGGILTALYGFVYVLLQMEDFTLLIGSIGLFFILAVMMFVSRKINWYGTEDAE